MKRIITILTILLSVTAIPAKPTLPDEASGQDNIVRILAIGNSFSEDAVEQYLYELADEAGVKVIIGNAYRGGQGLASHWSQVEEDKADFEYRKVTNGVKTNTTKQTLSSIVTNEPWDFITLQQVSQDSGLEATFEPYLTNLINVIKGWATNPDMKLGYHMTWAYAQDCNHSGFANYGNDQQTMYNAILHAVTVAKEAHPELQFIVPSGTAIQNARTSFLGDTFNFDGYHLTHGLGRYTAACTWLETILGISPVGLNFHPTSVDARCAKMLQKAAHAAVADPWKVTPINDEGYVGENEIIPAEVKINCGENTSSVRVWNNLTMGNKYLPNLTDVNGKETLMSVIINDAFNGTNLSGNQSTQTSLNMPADVSATCFWGYNEGNFENKQHEPTGGFLFSHLNKDLAYNFEIYGSRSGCSDIRQTVYTITGSNTASGTLDAANNTNQIVTLRGLRPDADGTLRLIASPGEDNTNTYKFYYINALRITATQPEPNEETQGARTFYIDYGQFNVSNQGFLTDVDANGNRWNNIHGKGTGAPDKSYSGTAANLVTSKGKATDCQVVLGTTFSTNGYSNGGLNNPSTSLLGDLAVQTATQDYIFLEGAQNYGVIHFRNLDPECAYRFHLFGSRTATDTRSAAFRLTGENVWEGEMTTSGAGIGAGGYDGNNNNILVSEPVFPDRDGHIDLTIIKQTSGAMIYLNCMKIEEMSDLPRPNTQLALAQKFYIDFGETSNNTRGHQTTGRDKNGNYWTNVTSGANNSNTIDANKLFQLRNSENKTTSGYRLKILHKSYTNGVDAGGNNAPNADELGDLAIQTATEDYMFIDNGDTRSFQLMKLNKENCYRFFIYGTRNHTDNRITHYTIHGQHDWEGGQATSGYNVGGEGVQGNVRNIISTDYIFPDRDGNIQFDMQRIVGMAHISAMRVEEYTGGTRPEEPLEFTKLQLTGNDEDVEFQKISSNVYEAYARLSAGTFRINGAYDKEDYTLYNTGNNTFDTAGDDVDFRVSNDCVARITVNTGTQEVSIMPVTMNVRGNMGAGNPAIPYKGAGVFEGEVTLLETSSQQWVDKTMYFALNNNDSYAIKRLQGAATRYALGEAEKGQNVENIYQNAGTYTISVDMVNHVYNIDRPIDENRISVFGSSVANGQGATDYMGYRYFEGQNLIRRHEQGVSDNAFYTSNVSIGGNTTTALLNRYDDLTRDFGRYVIFGLSLGNEGIHGASNQANVMNQWSTNMQTLISKAKAQGKIPMVMNNYTRSDYNESDYSYVKQLNLIIHQWDVASTNCLGSIDDGTGKWAEGYVSDTYHQNTAGHYEFFYSIVPSLFDAIKAGKSQPKRKTSKSMTLEAGKYISFTPEDIAHPFTLTLRVKGTEGKLFTINTSEGVATVKVNADATVTYTSPKGQTITSTNTISTTTAGYVTLTSYYAAKRTILYVGSTKAGELNERMGEIGLINVGDANTSRELRELFFWRSGMTPEEVSAVVSGKMLKSSLEIYAPLGGEDDMENLAQSTNRLTMASATTGKLVRTAQPEDVNFKAETGDAGFNGDENIHSLFDGTNKKWCLNFTEGTNIHVIFHANRPVSLSGYKITTGADCASWPGRNPKTWKLYGSTAAAGINRDDASWELITTVTNDSKLKDVNSQTYAYTLSSPSKTYTCFKWEISARKGGGSGVVQVEELIPTIASAQPATPITLTIDEGTQGWGDEVENILDDNASTKWNCWLQDGRAVAIMHTSQPIHIEGYEITTGNDNAEYHQRNPKDWVLYGSPAAAKPAADDPSWEPLYTVKDDQVLQDKNTTTYQFLGMPTRRAYQYYKWEITATQGDMLQVGEFNLYAREVAGIGQTDQLHVDETGWTTYVTPFDTDFTRTAGIEAHLVSQLEEENCYADLASIGSAPKGTAVVVKAEAGDYLIHATNEAVENVEDNLLRPTFCNLPVDAAQAYYVLRCPTQEYVGLHVAPSGAYIPADKGYLHLPATSAAEAYYFNHVDAIHDLHTTSTPTNTYTLQGIRLPEGRHLPAGIYIRHGKKVHVK